MSATMFTKIPENSKTKIPIPASPTPLRRHNSLRLKGEKSFNFTSSSRRRDDGNVIVQENPDQKVVANRDRHCNRFSSAETTHQSSSNPHLKRGRSFMDRSDRGVQNGTKRPENMKIGHRSPVDVFKNGTTPESPSRVRSLSLSLSNARQGNNTSKSPSLVTSSPNRQISADSRIYSTGAIDNWDNESITSIGSSVGSCDHSSVAWNGTTFSGRSMKYVFHCNQHSGAVGDDYLTPTQRAQKQVKKLKYLLQQAQKDLEEKDSDILKLTKEVVELRLYKAALSSPEDKSNSSDAITVRENNSNETTPEETIDGVRNHVPNELNGSFTDSGNFEDCTSSSVYSKESEECKSPSSLRKLEKATSTEEDQEHKRIIEEYERRFQELVRTHEEESLQLKQKHNEKVEELLQRISEINDRYWQLVPELEEAKERIKELEHQLEEASKKLEEQIAETAKTAKSEELLNRSEELVKHHNKIVELAQHPSRVSVPELLKELQVTRNELENIRDVEYASTSNNSQPLLSAKEALSLWVLGARKAMYRQLIEAKNKNKIDPEITLQFLKSAVYYFLTDKENSQGHLKAIQSILGFTPNEISTIERARLT
ncbi:protein quick-to-court isoform X1 [Diorhabda carinulata]|uniref:protein quick-to-court isoform X1 n=1 Tax=Diorhabda carinulata TaxID=1163345 RepID=UPI0025A1210D|nr:protein quick-to-court isoform X1 [Diorhabda carinulata]